MAKEAARVTAGVIFGNRASEQSPLTPETQGQVASWWQKRLAEGKRSPYSTFEESLKTEHYLGMHDVLTLLQSYNQSPLSTIPRNHPNYKTLMDYQKSTEKVLSSSYDELIEKVPGLKSFSNLTDVVSRVKYWLEVPAISKDERKKLQETVRSRTGSLISQEKEEKISEEVGFNETNLGKSGKERFVALYDYLADVVDELRKQESTRPVEKKISWAEQQKEGKRVVTGGELARSLIERGLVRLNKQGNGVDVDDQRLNKDEEGLEAMRELIEAYDIDPKKPSAQILPEVKRALEQAIENAWDMTYPLEIEPILKGLWPGGHFNPGVILGVGVVLTEYMRGGIIESGSLEKAKDNITAVDSKELGVSFDQPEYSLYQELYRIRSKAYQILKNPEEFKKWKSGVAESQIKYDWKDLINRIRHAGLVMPSDQKSK